MAWQFRNDIPIYTQLIAQIQQKIVSGALLPGERLPSVRDLAAEAGVNPNTMQRALMEMEREELVYSQRTAGRFVTEDGPRISKLREDLARNRVKDFLEGMYHLGFQMDEILTFVKLEGEKGNHEHSGM
ncbi:MAG: GntR family transcriptional regulator [Clostridiales bacterium]|nr:GntR family transcriptional regulator [Clostridiales bacterium]MDY4172513.1 GntR family transcriptional regulator [Evtepia sp.]